MAFVFTDHMVTVSNQLWEVTSIVGAALCFLVLLVIAVLLLHPVSRPHLDRVSFRILIYALVANTVFGIMNAVGGSFTGPTPACGFSIFLLQFTLELSSFLLFAIALNLQLVVVHRINGQRMEKYYILGSFVISLCITIPPYAAKQYGWDSLVEDCWYSNNNPKELLAWQIGTQLFWNMLTVVGEVCASLTVVIYMFKHQVRKRRPRSHSTGSRTRSRSDSIVSQSEPVVYANAYKGVIIRIGLYPLASCIINLTSVTCVVHATVTDGVHSMTDYRILLVSDFVYGGRAVLYALLAATDPSLMRALKHLIWHMAGKESPYPSKRDASWQMTNPTIQSRSGNPVEVQIELTTVHERDNGTFVPMSPRAKAHFEGPDGSFDALPISNKQIDSGVSSESRGEAAFADERGLRLDVSREAQIGRALERQRQEALERKQGRDAFKRQI